MERRMTLIFFQTEEFLPGDFGDLVRDEQLSHAFGLTVIYKSCLSIFTLIASAEHL